MKVINVYILLWNGEAKTTLPDYKSKTEKNIKKKTLTRTSFYSNRISILSANKKQTGENSIGGFLVLLQCGISSISVMPREISSANIH